VAAYLTIDSRKRGNGAARPILMIGLSDAGKTTLWTHLRYGKPFETCTSMVENEATIPLSVVYRVDSEQEDMDASDARKQINLVDIPGHEKLRQLVHSRLRFKDTSLLPRGILFVVDAATFGKQVRQVTDLLYDVLAESTVQKNDTPILIVCNKHDQWTAWDANRIRKGLEKEMYTFIVFRMH
jgi:signal recognition particle receptor subunit beta